MDVIHTIDIDDWNGPFPPELQARAGEALENGKVLFFPPLSFELETGERSLLTPEISNGMAKNVSLKPSGGLRGAPTARRTARSVG